MNEELATLTLGYLVGYYKTHEETIINQDEIDAINFFLNVNQQLKEQNERLLELCMYALISSTKIYNHKLANDTKKSFINIIKNNLNYDTYILKNKLLEAWRSDK